MKKLVYVAYSGVEEEFEVSGLSSWVVGIFDNDADVEKVVNEEIEDFINEELESRFDLEDDNMSEEDKKEIEDYRNCFEVYTTKKDNNYKLNKAEEYKELYLCDYYILDLKFYVVLIEE